MENKNNSLENLDKSSGNLVKKFAKIGFALENIFKPSSPSLLAIKLSDDETKRRLEKHLDNCEQKLNSVERDDICKTPDSVSIPLINELILLEPNALSEAFVNLLSKAATYSTLGEVHPAFITTLKNLSSDEANLLMYVNDKERIPFIDMYFKKFQEKIPQPENMDTKAAKTFDQIRQQIDYAFQDRKEVNIEIELNLTGLEEHIPLDFKENMQLYIYNMNRLGLLDFTREQYIRGDEELYDKIEKFYSKEIDELKESASKYDQDDYKLKFISTRGFIKFSEYGKAFMKSCIKSIEKK